MELIMNNSLFLLILAFGLGVFIAYKIEKSNYKPIGSGNETQKEKNEKEFEEKVIKVEENSID